MIPGSGTWVRRGTTIVLNAPADESSSDSITGELESGRPTLRRGSRGSAVSSLQSRLADLGFSPGPADGVFGALTYGAVRAFQKSRGLLVDGIVGPQTWAALDAWRPARPTQPLPSAPPRWGGSGAVQLKVPFRGFQDNDKAGCFRRCTEMAAAVGVRVGGPDVRIQVAVRESALGAVTVDPAKAREGIAYINAELDAGRPVVVGVSYTDASYNVDDITDHFVIITRRGVDTSGRAYYGFHDPASSHLSTGGDQNPANRFYSTSEGGLFRPASSAAPLGSKVYGVSMVRRNV